ncbi:MAG: hypothetical protein QW476_03780 [Candidatus Bathyarchaeia archaeon]
MKVKEVTGYNVGGYINKFKIDPKKIIKYQKAEAVNISETKWV